MLLVTLALPFRGGGGEALSIRGNTEVFANLNRSEVDGRFDGQLCEPVVYSAAPRIQPGQGYRLKRLKGPQHKENMRNAQKYKEN